VRPPEGEGVRVEVEVPARLRGGAVPAAWAGRPVFALGFRVFFLLGAVAAVLLVSVWILMFVVGVPAPGHLVPVQWHAHEMLFGFAGAIIAGFLLTAPGVWTGRPMPRGAPVAAMAALWLAGRAMVLLPGLVPFGLIVAVDAAFFPVVGWAVYRVLRGDAGHRRNQVFPVLLLAMTGANVLSHLGVRNAMGVAVGTELMLYLVLVMIAVMGGRVIPFFTRNRLPAGTSRVHPWVDIPALAVLLAVIPADLVCAPAPVVAALCAAAAVLHAIRLAAWYTRGIWGVPLLWILHVGYAWLVVGLLLRAATTLQWAPPLLWRHAFAAGTIGVVIFGMICRVSLGHTGRPLEPPRFVTGAFVAINAAVVLRVFLPWADPAHYRLWLALSACAWVYAFGVYLLQYTGMLCSPRADGRPG
jgi:uncharacterized protein involved in response to NO